MRLHNKVVVITGAARGIGLACAESCVAEGAKVVVSDIEEQMGEHAVQLLRGEDADVVFVHCDVGEKTQVDALMKQAVEHYGRVDTVISNAAIVHAMDFLDVEEQDFDRVIRVNLKGMFLTGQAAARQMVNQGGGGTIVMMSSVNGVMAIPNIAPYVVAKGGVNQLIKVMAVSLAEHGIRVNGIGPESIATEMVKQVLSDPEKAHGALSRTPLGRFGQPEEIGKIAVFLASEDSSYITGQIIYPDGRTSGA